MSHLDEAAVQTLSLMTRITEAVGVPLPSPLGAEHFALQLVDGRESDQSPEYLEQALTPPHTSVRRDEGGGSSVFPTRHLVTLPRPKGESAQSGTRDDRRLQPKSEKYLTVFRDHVRSNVRPHAVAGVEVGGAVTWSTSETWSPR